MTWGIENNVIERFAGAGVPKEKISFARDTYMFEYPAAPSDLVSAFRKYYGPTMNAFEARKKTAAQPICRRNWTGCSTARIKVRTRMPLPFLQPSCALALRLRRASYVRFGSKADICNAQRHVCFTRISGHVRCNSECPLCANSGHSRMAHRKTEDGLAAVSPKSHQVF